MEPPDSLTLRIRRWRFPTKALCISRYSCSFARKRFVYTSPIVTINGEKATSYVENWSQFGSLQGRDALYINIFYELAQVTLGTSGSGMGTFTGGGRGRFTQELRRNRDLLMGRKSPIRILRKFSLYLPASRAEGVFTSCGSLLPQALQPAKMRLLPIRHRQHLQPPPHQQRRCLPPQPVLQLQDTHHELSFR